MITSGQLLAFGLAAFVLIAIPGPSVVFVIGRALVYGRAVALATVVGNSLGLLVIITAVALGLGVVVAESVLVFTVVKLVGGGVPRVAGGPGLAPPGGLHCGRDRR